MSTGISDAQLNEIMAQMTKQHDAIVAKLKERLHEQEQRSAKMEHNWLDRVHEEKTKLEEHATVYRTVITALCVVGCVAFITMFIWMSQRAMAKIYQTECRVRGGITVVNTEDKRMCVNANALIKTEAK